MTTSSPAIALNDLPPPAPGRIGWPWTKASAPPPPTMPDGRPWPRISIVTPSYNQADFLEETIRSVLLQGYPNLQYMVLDGGSSDGSAAIIRAYAPWLDYWRSERDGGQSAAIADGFARSDGEIIAWLNSDDRYEPGSLLRAAQFFASQPRTVFGNGDVYFIDAASAITRRLYAVPPNRFLTANLGKYVSLQPGCFWRRAAYEAAGGMDRALRFCMDRDLFIRLGDQGPCRRIPGPPLAAFRVHERAKSSTIRDVAQAESAILVARYGRAWISARRWLLNELWRLWYRPTGLRAKLNRRFGWEW